MPGIGIGIFSYNAMAYFFRLGSFTYLRMIYKDIITNNKGASA